MTERPPPRPRSATWRPVLIGLLLVGAALGFGVCGAEHLALAADLTGAIAVPAAAPTPEADAPHYWEEWNGFLDPRPRPFDASRELAVVLLGAGAGAPVGCTPALDGGDLKPRTVVARVGTPVRIENRGAAAHELWAPGLAELTPLQTAPGNARSVSIPRAGSWPLRDRVFPHVSGTLVVLPDLVACAQVAPDGSFRLPDVAPGAYRVALYRGGEKVAETPVEVENRNLTIEDLALP